MFAILYFLASFLYIIGYGGYLGAQYGAQGEMPDPAEIQAAVAAHLQTPAAIVGSYLVQFFLIIPVLLAVANFKTQSLWSTLAVRPFAIKLVWLWIGLLLVFLAAQSFLVRLLDVAPGEFMQMLAGSRHLPLVLVIVLVAPVLEELIFRGYLFTAWRQSRLGLTGTLLLTSALFALMHWGQYHWVQAVFIFILALMLGIAREKSGSVLLPMLLHGLNNLASAIVVIYLGIL
ncbi:CPBP family intramembrane metalloprotease [Microbulbifer thermotolerans]|uniref:CPBP family intramembrane glutamic endopeptidase n=2 Tax=Microbulbifer thermotolerans TaxID=252514 RepID=UPI00224911F8|nr:type II CAAX endopeptidase family protein [Microbulbifer thermotolerans]MCX2784211.1 CPBP family intramembrane metalloprotease [Microbulbifer thermotolerans]MCX2796140.1 CPBP family intramembrane metalloprotease [Microbulbifer thermotolerans]